MGLDCSRSYYRYQYGICLLWIESDFLVKDLVQEAVRLTGAVQVV